MKTCEICGNPIENKATICPYCAQPLEVFAVRAPIKTRKTAVINLEIGKPFVKEALEKFDIALKMAQTKDIGILKIIHGYGSTGTGGKIKEALRNHLKTLLNNKTIKGFIAGENYSKSTNAPVNKQKITDVYPELLETQRADSYNQGISFVEL